MDMFAVEHHTKKSLSVNHCLHLTLKTTDLSCAPNVTLSGLSQIHQVHPAVQPSDKGWAPSMVLWLPSNLHPPLSRAPRQGRPYFIPLGWLCKRLSCHSIHHINSVLPDWRTKRGVINRAWLDAPPCPSLAPSRDSLGSVGWDEGIGGPRPGWRAARAEPSDWGICWHSSGAPSHTNTHTRCGGRRQRSAGGACQWRTHGAPQAHFTQLRNRPSPAAREGQYITGLVWLSTRVMVMD